MNGGELLRHDALVHRAFGEKLTLWQLSRICMAVFISVPGLTHIFNTVFATAKTDFVCHEQLIEESVWPIDFQVLREGNRTNMCCESMLEEGHGQYIFDHSFWKDTLPMHFGLACHTRHLITVSKMSLFTGLAAGTFVAGFISDKFGRIPATLICSQIVLASGFASTLVQHNFFLFCALWFIVGASSIGVFTVMFIWSTEIVSSGHTKTAVGVLLSLTWSLARFLSVGLAYSTRDWRQTLRITSALHIFTPLLLFFFIPESPRWLLASRKDEQRQRALKILIKAAHQDRKQLLRDVGLSDVAVVELKGKRTEPTHLLLTSSTLRTRTLVMFYNWFATSFVAYGVNLNWQILTGSLFLNFLIASVLSVPTKVLATFALLRLRRRKLLFTTLMGVAGLCFLATRILGIGRDSKVALATCFILGYLNISACFSILWLYTAELFPTSLRNTAVGASSFSARLGGILATTVTLLGEINLALPTVAFASACLLSLLLSLLLPETMGKALPDSLQQAINMEEEQKESDKDMEVKSHTNTHP